MLTRQRGWVAAFLGFAAGSSGFAIFRTTNGGAHWQLIELTFPNRLTPGAIPFACDKTGVVFSSARTGWVTGTCSGGRPVFWVSQDGGRAWRQQPLPRPYGRGSLTTCQCFITAPVFTSARDGALWVRRMPGPPSHGAAGYLTHDGGRTWAPVHLPGGRVPLQTPDFVDGSHGFVIGGLLGTNEHGPRNVRLYATMDGGTTWTVRSANPQLDQATLVFVTPVVGFASVISYNPFRSHLLETRNGGASWIDLPAQMAIART